MHCSTLTLDAVGARAFTALLRRGLATPGDSGVVDEWSFNPDDFEVLVVEWVERHAEAFRAA